MPAFLTELPAPVFIALTSLIGLLVGSFLNVVIYRVPVMLSRQAWADATILLGDGRSHKEVFGQERSERLRQVESDLVSAFDKVGDFDLIRPASRCGNCGHRIRAWENVPVLSWLALRGKCSDCGVRIAARYPLVEMGCAVLFGLVAWYFGASLETLAWLVFVAMGLAASLIDLDKKILPDVIVIPMVWLGLIASAFGWLQDMSAERSIAAAAIGYCVPWALARGFELVTKRTGMGGGDFKFMAAIGAWCGVPNLLVAAVFACVLTLAAIAVAKIVRRSSGDVTYPFGPALFASALASVLLDLPIVLSLEVLTLLNVV